MIRLLILASVAFRLTASCIAIDGPRVKGKDIAAYAPGLDPERELGPAPAVGQSRWLSPAEIVEIAARAGQPIPKPASSICIKQQGTGQVKKGDSIELEVRAGGAVIRLDARAETDGAFGGPIWVRDLASGRRVQATVENSGKAVILK